MSDRESGRSDDPGRWRRAKELFSAAAALPPEERGAFLVRACGNDAALLAEVTSLLDHHAEDPGFMEPTASAEADALIGTTVSHYRIVERLGAGAMGVVYRAHDTRLDRPVALKFLWPRAVRFGEALEPRFLNEARAVSAIDHPNVGAVYEIDRASDGRLFIAMAFYEGETLKERIARGPLPPGDAIAIGAQLAAALSAAHDRGVTHRDVKPANVILTANGSARLIDFGIAKTPSPEELTRTGETLGTIAYMSPEQATGEAVDARSDLWSLGVVLFEMVSGRLPFDGPHEVAALRAILHDDPPALGRTRPDLPAPLVGIIERCLRKRRGERVQSAGEVVDTLSSLAADSSPPGSPRTERQGRRTALGALAAAAVVVAVGAVALLRGGGGAPVDPIGSIAVLPFDNLSGDPEQDYFVGGMQEALLNSLAQIEALRVTSRTSTLRYTDTDLSAPEIAAELGVESIVEGGVFPVGDTVRITVQLIDGRTDGHIWTGQYDRDVRDVLVLFSEVAETVAGEIEVAIAPDEADRLATAAPVDPRLFDLYMRGRAAFATLSPEGMETAASIFEESIRIDSTYARGWAGLGVTRLLQAYLEFMPPADGMRAARRAALRAVALDPQLASAHTALGWVELAGLELGAAATSFLRALDLNPNDVDALHGFGDVLTITGRADEGLVYVERAQALDPYSPIWGHTVVGHLHMMGRFEDALAESARVLERWPEAPVVVLRVAALWELGRYDEAMGEVRTALQTQPQRLRSIEGAYEADGPVGAARVFAEGWAARVAASGTGAFQAALWYGRAGDAERTLEWLARTRESGGADLYLVSMRPEFGFLHADPRFQDFIASLGLPPVEAD